RREMVKKGMREWRGGRSAPTEYPMSETTRAAFQRALRAMNKARVPYSIGGALALHWYSGFWRVAKDLDLFVLPEHLDWAMGVLASSGFSTRIRHPQWLAEAILEPNKVDLVFGMGNWLQYVDRAFIEEARPGIVLGEKSWIAPPEEMIYSKAFVASRERYDAADIYHLLVAVKGQLDWSRLLMRFEEHWEVLLSHLVLFRYVYPSHRDIIPGWVLDQLLSSFQETRREPWTGGKLCRGFLLDGIGTYSLDIKEWGYRDAREEAWEELQLRSAKAA
ncbi:MAG: hypothetical protein ACOX87_13845, partial [Chloroflexota bacterium]